jgi:hypothetical protein
VALSIKIMQRTTYSGDLGATTTTLASGIFENSSHMPESTLGEIMILMAAYNNGAATKAAATNVEKNVAHALSG